jgi:hypothetical protein
VSDLGEDAQGDTLRGVIRLIVTCLVLLLTLIRPASAQTITDGRAWATLSLQGRVSPESRWRWSFDSIARSREGVTELDVTTFRPMLSYDVDAHSSVSGGYAYVSTYPVTGGVTTEHRVFGIYTWSGLASGGTLSMRVRVEDRMIEANSGVLWRARPQARFTHPVHPGSRVAIVGSDELSVHLNTTTRSPRGIDQNRAFGGIQTTWSPNARTEIGYLNQFIPGHGNPSRMNHIVSTTVTMTF